MNTNDGGPAFPGFGQVHTTDAQGRCGPQSMWGLEGSTGMSLRDYFACAGPQPGRAEICNLLGWQVSEHQPWPRPKDAPDLPHFDDLWRALPLSEQMRVSAVCRYAFADAMLTAREATRSAAEQARGGEAE